MYALNQSGVRTLLAATAFKTSDYVGMVNEVRPQCPGLKDVIYLGISDWDELCDRPSSVSEDELSALVTL
jgi:fatty-acyl-CoA synthase